MVFRKSLIENVEESCQVKSISAVPEEVVFNFSSYESLESYFYFLKKKNRDHLFCIARTPANKIMKKIKAPTVTPADIESFSFSFFFLSFFCQSTVGKSV